MGVDWLNYVIYSCLAIAGYFGMRFQNRIDGLDLKVNALEKIPDKLENAILKHEIHDRENFVTKQDFINTLNRIHTKIETIDTKLDKLFEIKEDKA